MWIKITDTDGGGGSFINLNMVEQVCFEKTKDGMEVEILTPDGAVFTSEFGMDDFNGFQEMLTDGLSQTGGIMEVHAKIVMNETTKPSSKPTLYN